MINIMENERINYRQDECIVSACNRYEIDGKEYLVMGVRHFDPIMCANLEMLNKIYGKEFETKSCIQGFITNRRRFVDRIEGKKIATKTGQDIYSINLKDLYSENLY